MMMTRVTRRRSLQTGCGWDWWRRRSRAPALWWPDKPQPSRPRFEVASTSVTIRAVVRDGKGRPVMTLAKTDFELLDNGTAPGIIPISTEPRAGERGAARGLQRQHGGSRGSRARAPRAIPRSHIWLNSLSQAGRRPGRLSSCSIQSAPFEVQAIAPAPGGVVRGSSSPRCRGLYGCSTSLFDAIAETGLRARLERAVTPAAGGNRADRRRRQREQADRLRKCRGIAPSGIDVPVYIVSVIVSLGHDPRPGHRRRSTIRV